jgi:hypothetical protein
MCRLPEDGLKPRDGSLAAHENGRDEELGRRRSIGQCPAGIVHQAEDFAGMGRPLPRVRGNEAIEEIEEVAIDALHRSPKWLRAATSEERQRLLAAKGLEKTCSQSIEVARRGPLGASAHLRRNIGLVRFQPLRE